MAKNLFINLSPQSLKDWDEKQIRAAQSLRKSIEIVDTPFPKITAKMKPCQIRNLANYYVFVTLWYTKEYDTVFVHIMGENSFVFYFVNQCKIIGIVYCFLQ